MVFGSIPKLFGADLWPKICFGLKEGQDIIIFEFNGLLKNENTVNVVIYENFLSKAFILKTFFLKNSTNFLLQKLEQSKSVSAFNLSYLNKNHF